MQVIYRVAEPGVVVVILVYQLKRRVNCTNPKSIILTLLLLCATVLLNLVDDVSTKIDSVVEIKSLGFAANRADRNGSERNCIDELRLIPVCCEALALKSTIPSLLVDHH